MTDLIKISQETDLSIFDSWEDANREKGKAAWKKLASLSVREAIGDWLRKTENKQTKKAYHSGMKRLHDIGIVNVEMSLQAFSLINHNDVIDEIKLVPQWSEATKQARAACYISFTGYLARKTEGVIKKAIPARLSKDKTFFRVSEKVKTEKLVQSEWQRYFEVFDRFNPRDALIGKMLLEGGRRVNEVLSRDIEHIDWDNNQVKFQISKTKGTEQFITITYSQKVMDQLKKIVGKRESGAIFITENGNRVQYGQVIRSFGIAGKRARIPFKVTTHVMRVSLVSYLMSQNYDMGKIMEVTGQSAQTVSRYNRQDPGDNISKVINCFGD